MNKLQEIVEKADELSELADDQHTEMVAVADAALEYIDNTLEFLEEIPTSPETEKIVAELSKAKERLGEITNES